jgi:choline dehydrogenase-like flavoprotein
MSTRYRAMGASVALGATATPYVQGRMVGGSSPINGAICWRTPRDVYDAWVRDDPALAEGLPWERLEAATDDIEARLGVAPTSPDVAGRKDALMARGAEALGLAHRPIRRNVVGCRGSGRCLQGCPHGAKRSADVSLLADAEDAGAVLLHGAEVTSIEVHRGRATGVVARTAGGAPVRVRARHAVVLAASAIQTPALLLQSGITGGPVGHGFQAHPGVSVLGKFPEPVRSWEGSTQGHEVVGLRSEGLKFESLGFDLSLLAARLGGVGASLAREVAELDRWACWGAAVRASARGRVRVTLGHTWVAWSPNAADLALYRRGIRVLGEMMLAAGATRLSLGVRGAPEDVDEVGPLRDLEERGPRSASAYRAVITHMFGTARAGSDPSASVARPDLRHHRVEGLYLADSSVFPTHLGVNPQVPIMAVAQVAGGHVLARAR